MSLCSPDHDFLKVCRFCLTYKWSSVNYLSYLLLHEKSDNYWKYSSLLWQSLQTNNYVGQRDCLTSASMGWSNFLWSVYRLGTDYGLCVYKNSLLWALPWEGFRRCATWPWNLATQAQHLVTQVFLNDDNWLWKSQKLNWKHDWHSQQHNLLLLVRWWRCNIKWHDYLPWKASPSPIHRLHSDYTV